MANPACEVKNGAAAFASTINGANVTPGNVIVIRLASTAGVDAWGIECLTTDDTSDADAVNASLVIDALAKTATFTAPAEGHTFRFQSRVAEGPYGLGRDRNNVVQPAFTTTFCVYTLIDGRRVHALDETTEGGEEVGWGADVNAIIRAGGSGGSAVVAQDIAKSAGSTIDRVRGIRGVGIAGSDGSTPPVGGTIVYNEHGGSTYKHKKPVMPGHFDVADYGAIADYDPGTDSGTDNLAAFNACLAAAKAYNGNGASKIVIDGYYRLGGTWHIRQTVVIAGSGNSAPTSGVDSPRSAPGTWLGFPTDTDGIHFHHQGEAEGGGDYSTIRDLTIYCQHGRAGSVPQPAGANTGNGIIIRSPVTVKNVTVDNFAENGILVSAGNDAEYSDGNAGGFRLDGCRCDSNGMNGYMIEGGDATVGFIVNCSGTVNHGWGFKDRSIGTSTYVACHAEGNRGFHPELGGNYSEYCIENDVGSNSATLIGCYAEGTFNHIGPHVQCIGGSLSQPSFQQRQDGSQGVSGMFGTGNAVAGMPLTFSNTSGTVETLIEFGQIDASHGGVDGVALTFGTPSHTDYNRLRWEETTGYWQLNSSNPYRNSIQFPTTVSNPRRIAPLFENGIFFGTPAALSSPTSVSSSIVAHTAASATPTAGTFGKGDVVWNSDPDGGEAIGWVCTARGTLGTLLTGSPTFTTVKGAISSGSATLVCDDAQNVNRWDHILIAGVTGSKQVIAKSGNTLTLDSNANATVVSAAVTWDGAATFATMGTVGGGSGFTAGGDLSGSSTVQSVVGITGASGVVPIATTGNVMTWASTTTAPGLAHTASSTANGAAMTIAAQSTSFDTGAAGQLNLFAGSASGATTGTGANVNIVAGNSSSATGTGGSVDVRAGTGTTAGSVNIRYGSTTVLQVRGLSTTTSTIQWTGTQTAPTINQALIASGTPATMAIQAQGVTTGTGGNLDLKGGTGSVAYGQVKASGHLNVGAFTQAMADAAKTISAANSIANVITTTGANTAVRALTITCAPSTGLVKLIKNSCTGFGITVQWLTGAATATIPPGSSAIVGSDGTDATLLLVPGTGGSATPGGSSGALQYNNGGVLDGLTNVNGGSGFLSVGATTAATGSVRLANTGYTAFRNAANSGDVVGIVLDNADNLFIGSDSTGAAKQAATVRIYPAGGIELNAAGTPGLYLNGTSVRSYQPIVGQSSPYGLHGVGVQAMADANQTAASSIYSFGTIETTGALTANRTLTIPSAASDDLGYYKVINNVCTGAFSVVVATASGTTVTVANGTSCMVLVDTRGVTNVSPAAGGSVAIGSVTGLGTGVATFLGTPTSANLISALTDETGTGNAVFSTSPTFKTGILLNNPANTFAYTFTPAAITAARTITLPLLTASDTMVTAAFAQTLTNKTMSGASNTFSAIPLASVVGPTGTGVVKATGTAFTAAASTIVDADVSASAAIAYSKLGTGTQTIGVSGFDYTVQAKAIVRDRLPVTIQTTTATQTVIDSFTLPSNTMVRWTVEFTGTKSDSSQCANYTRTAVFRNTGGTVAQVGSTVDGGTFEDDVSWDATIDNSTTTIRALVTGKAATTITWTATSSRIEFIA